MINSQCSNARGNLLNVRRIRRVTSQLRERFASGMVLFMVIISGAMVPTVSRGQSVR
ncbi:hypothetical protein Pla22_13040 [Rubripirellula amarantea]|uniref:Uncharacterized protein n=1 Tax=Rubripirellula amarantea TaxID=2527999 RepID=A0A5C5WUJ8_9BACT|nr:hypothetical protein Pla22_13040 [Rubripirellula amarantea]